MGKASQFLILTIYFGLNVVKVADRTSLAASKQWLDNQKSSCFPISEVTQADHPMKD